MSPTDRMHQAVWETIETYEDDTGNGLPFEDLFHRVNRALRRRRITVARETLKAHLSRMDETGMLFQDAAGGWRLG